MCFFSYLRGLGPFGLLPTLLCAWCMHYSGVMLVIPGGPHPCASLMNTSFMTAAANPAVATGPADPDPVGRPTLRWR